MMCMCGASRDEFPSTYIRTIADGWRVDMQQHIMEYGCPDTNPAELRSARMPSRDWVQPVDRTSALPLWAQMQEDLRRRLGTGAFAEHFPTELELVEQYAV